MSFWNDIKHFAPKEFDSPDLPGSGAAVDPKIVWVLERARISYGQPIKVNSGVRSREHNEKVNGKSVSGHLVKNDQGHAVDVRASNSRLRFLLVHEALKSGIKRIGIAKSFVHLDSDPALPQQVIWMY